MSATRRLNRPLSLKQFSDGCCYDCSGFLRPSTKALLHVRGIDDVFIKAATPRLLDPLAQYLSDLEKLKESDLARYDRVRLLEDIERPSNFGNALKQYPEFQSSLEAIETDETTASINDASMLVMFLILCRSNLDRLKRISTVAIPKSHFVIVNSVAKRFPPWSAPTVSVAPAIVQEKVSGTMLWDMYSPGAEAIKPTWKPFVDCISEQLRPMLHAEVARYIDWSPENFLFDTKERKVYYVDSEPNIWMGMRANEHNLRGIRRFFCV